MLPSNEQAKDVESPGDPPWKQRFGRFFFKAACWSVACSGGLDSVVLLHVLKRLAALGKDLIVLHFNHQLWC